MKKFYVINNVRNESQIAGREPYSDVPEDFVGGDIEAETAEEAIILAIDYLIARISECYNSSDYTIDHELDSDHFTVYKNGTAIENWYNFTAVEI